MPPSLVPPLTERWRRTCGPTLLGNLPPEGVGDVVVVADLGGVRAVATSDGEPRWDWRLASLGEKAPADLQVRWMRSVGEVLVVAAAGGGEAWLVGLGAGGERRWASSRLADSVEEGQVADGRLVVWTTRGADAQLLGLDPASGQATVELLPRGLTDPVRCAGGWCFRAGEAWPGVPGVAWRADGGAGVVVWPAGAPTAVHAVGEVVAVVANVPGEGRYDLSVWSTAAGRELWRVDDVFWQVAAGPAGLLLLDRPGGPWRPRRLDLLTGREQWVGEPLRRDAVLVDAGEVVVCAGNFEIRLLGAETGAVVQAIPVPRGLAGRRPRMVADGRLHVATEGGVIAYGDARA